MSNVSIKNKDTEKSATIIATDNEFKRVINLNDIDTNQKLKKETFGKVERFGMLLEYIIIMVDFLHVI